MEGSATVNGADRPSVEEETANEPAAVPSLLYSDVEDDLRASLRALLEDRCDWPVVLERIESGEPYDTGLWHSIAAELGCAGLLVPEDHGGAGASYREAAVAAEELGKSAAPVPYLGSAVVATAALLAASDDALLPKIASGAATAALLVPFGAWPDAPAPRTVRLSVPQPGDQAAGVARLAGTAAGLADALPADVLIVPADGVPYGLYAVDAAAAGVTRTPVVSLDMTRQLCDIALRDAPARLIVSGDAAERALSVALTAGAAMLAAEQLGLAERCLELTVAYVKQRYQFARPVGSFQGLKHRLADLWVAVTQARAAARYAAACMATDHPDTPVAVALAKSCCCEVAVKAAEECVQMHGGIGFTWEHPAHLYLKRAKSASIAFGTPDRYRASLAVLADLPA
ncbi:MAG: acyl-CoA dehydrogenase family protein [Micromonosporaceae bacterium]